MQKLVTLSEVKVMYVDSSTEVVKVMGFNCVDGLLMLWLADKTYRYILCSRIKWFEVTMLGVTEGH